MKKIICAVLAALITASGSIYAYAGIYVDFEKLNTDYVIENGRTLVPLRGIFEKVGYDVDYNAASKTAVLSGDKTITVTAGQNGFDCNSKWYKCEVPQKIINGRFFLPLRNVIEVMNGYEVQWVADSKNIHIVSRKMINEIENFTDAQKGDFVRSLNGEIIKDLYSMGFLSNEIENKSSYNVKNVEITNNNTDNNKNLNVLEKQVLELINAERTSRGLSALQWDDSLAEVARAHSKDMAEKGYFSHTGLDGSSSSDRIKRAGIKYNACAENIAAGSRTAEDVVKQWMNSEGHRNNILNPAYGKMGVGLWYNDSSEYSYYWTECFKD